MASGAAGENGQLFVRPEKLTLRRGDAPPGEGVNRLTGTVRRASFLGNVVRYAVETPGGILVTADAPNLSGGHRPGPGEPAAVEWSPDDTAVLPLDAP